MAPSNRHFQLTCIAFVVIILQTNAIRISIPHGGLHDKLKLSLPITLKIEAGPHGSNTLRVQNATDQTVSENVSDGHRTLPHSPIDLPLQSVIANGLPHISFVEGEEDEVGTRDGNIKIPFSFRIGTTEGSNETDTEKGRHRLKAPEALQVATKLFTYVLGMNMTSNKGRRPICDCGRRRLDGVFPYLDLNAKKKTENETKVSGGAEAIPNEFPWRVGIQGGPNGVFCGGSIIDNGWIITAAHCLHDLDPRTVIYVNAGDHDISTVTETDNVVIKASGWHIHPNYDPHTFDNNIALIRLQRDLIFRDNIQPICLPYKLVDDDLVGATAVTGGWGPENEGSQASKVLRRVDLPVLSANQIRGFTKQLVTDNMIGTMTTGRDACAGDLGGTLDIFDVESARYQIIGIASHGQGCARVNAPRVYTKVTNYLEFVHSVTRAAFCVK